MCAWGTAVFVKGAGEEPEAIRANGMRLRRPEANEGALACGLATKDLVLPVFGQNREDSGRRVRIAGEPGAGQQNLRLDRAGDLTAALEGVGDRIQLVAAEDRADVAADAEGRKRVYLYLATQQGRRRPLGRRWQ